MKGVDRFSNKAEKYELYRPEYPEGSISKILKLCEISNNKVKIADIGFGTGKFTKLLLDKGFTVYAIEPNEQMRAIAENKFINYDNFNSINRTAETTGLEDNSISIITVAQAFHYFDLDKVKKEFKRILKLEGKVVLLWNFRSRESNFIKEYENIIYNLHSSKIKPTHAQDNMTDKLFKDFFTNYKITNISNVQEFDFDSLWGRTLSNNHMPNENEPEYQELYNDLKKLFNKYQKDGKILFEYRTQIVVGDFTTK